MVYAWVCRTTTALLYIIPITKLPTQRAIQTVSSYQSLKGDPSFKPYTILICAEPVLAMGVLATLFPICFVVSFDTSRRAMSQRIDIALSLSLLILFNREYLVTPRADVRII